MPGVNRSGNGAGEPQNRAQRRQAARHAPKVHRVDVELPASGMARCNRPGCIVHGMPVTSPAPGQPCPSGCGGVMIRA